MPTILFFPKMFVKAISEGVFQAVYFYKPVDSKSFLKRLPFIFVFLGLIGLPILGFNVQEKDDFKLFWGGSFETSLFYILFSASSLLITFYLWKKKDKKYLFYLIVTFLFIGIVVLTHRRSYIAAIPIVYILILLILYRSELITKKFLLTNLTALLVGLIGTYTYLSVTDERFKILNEVIFGKKEFNYHNLNRISSTRLGILMDGLEIIGENVREGNVLNLLLGHGIRSGKYLPHKRSPESWERYESVILVSELIERGLIGLVSIAAFYIFAFRRFMRVRIKDPEQVLYLMGFVPLLVHLVGAIFTFFWDALLPLFLVLFRTSELALRERG